MGPHSDSGGCGHQTVEYKVNDKRYKVTDLLFFLFYSLLCVIIDTDDTQRQNAIYGIVVIVCNKQINQEKALPLTTDIC